MVLTKRGYGHFFIDLEEIEKLLYKERDLKIVLLGIILASVRVETQFIAS